MKSNLIKKSRIGKRRFVTRTIPAASAKTFRRKFTVLRQGGNSVRVTGRDLIYPIPDSLVSPVQATNVMAVIPANPVYWTGTRIAALASGYQNYRPIKFKVSYVPICAVTQQGNVIGGTIWDDGIAADNIQQSLRTSNGGFLTQCYVPYDTTIRPKSNLQFNLYRVGGDFDQNSNPFLFVAISIGCIDSSDRRIVPGYFYVTWSFELKNPIGKVSAYYNSGLTTYSTYTPQMNNTVVNLQTTTDIPFGAYINIETEESSNAAYYNGTPVTIESTTPVWIFQSVAKSTQTIRISKLPIYYTSLTTDTMSITAKKPDTNATNYTTFEPIAFAFVNEEQSIYEIYEFELLPNNATITDDLMFTINNTYGTVFFITTMQAFGVYQSSKTLTVTKTTTQTTANLTCSYYHAPKDQFVLELQNNSQNLEKHTQYIHFKTVQNKMKDLKIEDKKHEELDEIHESDEEDEIQLNKVRKHNPTPDKRMRRNNIDN
jgi:hypothetical protein